MDFYLFSQLVIELAILCLVTVPCVCHLAISCSVLYQKKMSAGVPTYRFLAQCASPSVYCMAMLQWDVTLCFSILFPQGKQCPHMH